MKHYISQFLLCIAVLFAACEPYPTFILPEVETMPASSVGSVNAILEGRVIRMKQDGNKTFRRGFEISEYQSFANKSRKWYDKKQVYSQDMSTNPIRVLVENLKDGTTYYYRFILDPEDGYSEVFYGQTMSFTTHQEHTVKVEAEMGAYTSRTALTKVTATQHNNVLKEVGVLLGMGPLPSLQEHTGKQIIFEGSTETNVTGVAAWSNLEPKTKYYFRPYVIDAEGKASYGNTVSCTTSSESGGTIKASDFVGTYHLNAYVPWENTNILWDDVQILPYNGDTLFAVGFNGRNELRAVGIFDQGRQVVRFESGWYFDNYSFTYKGQTCVAMFTPMDFDESDQQAHLITNGGRNGLGEIWLKKNSTNSFKFVASDGPSTEGWKADGFIFNYYVLSTWEKVGNSEAYTNVTMTRIANTTTRNAPAHICPIKSPKKQ